MRLSILHLCGGENMEKMLRKGQLLSVVVLLAFVLLATSFEGVIAIDKGNQQNVDLSISQSIGQTELSYSNQTLISPSNQTGLSDFLVKLCEYQSRGNATVLARLEREWKQQEVTNQAISHENPHSSPITSSSNVSKAKSVQTLESSWNTGYYESLLGSSEPTVNPYTYETIGQIINPSYVLGDGPDSNAAYFETTGWYDSTGGEALTWGLTSTQFAGTAEFHAIAKGGNSGTGWHNYLIVSVSMTANWNDWHPVYYVEVHSNDFEDFTIGSICTMFKYITVMSWCPTGITPYEKSSLYVDSVEFIEDSEPATLTISANSGGSTSPSSGTYYVSAGTIAEVTALPDYDNGYVLDHWELDSNYAGSNNPIVFIMYTDRSLQAVFSYLGSVWLTVEAKDDAGMTVSNANIYVDNSWIGTGYASVYLPLGYHVIDADSYVWDEYYGTYVFPVSGTGSIYLTGDTYTAIHYTY